MDASQPTLHRPSLPIGAETPKKQSDYGTLGPALDIASSRPAPPIARSLKVGPAVTVAAGVLLAVLVGGIGTARAAWQHITNVLSVDGETSRNTPQDGKADRTKDASTATDPTQTDLKQTDLKQTDLAQLDRLDPQRQAEFLLEQAVGDSTEAVDQISSRADQWQGKIKWNSQIANLSTVALTSRDLRVRESGVQVELAAYGLARTSASLNYLLRLAESRDHAKKIWALWALGLLANRGMGTGPAVRVLTAHLKDPDQESRRWAVASLAVVGTPQTIPPLLRTFHDDPSLGVRQSAAMSLAESGMLTRDERLAAVPQLLNYTEDPALDGQTRTWAFQALGEITGQRLPNDSSTWRLWYTSAKVD
jgi:hypothetical protein